MKLFNKYRQEVLDRSLFEFTEEEFVKMHRDEAREEGRAEGRAEILKKLINSGCEKKFILDLDYSEDEYEDALRKMN